jgi:RNA polymerase sigma factor (sigma-70 family)
VLAIVVNNIQPQTEAYKLIENHYRANAHRLVKRYANFLNSKERAEDVVQSAYERCCVYWNDCPKDAEGLAKWFTVILHNALKDNHRQEIMQGAVSYKEEDEPQINPAAIPAIIYKQVVDRIKSKSPRHARILSLSLLNQYRPADIAEVVPENQAGIRKIVSRFRKEIKGEFGWSI